MEQNEIETYKLTENTEYPEGFALKRMEDIHKQLGGTSDKPHRHDYFTVIFVDDARGEHFIDFKKYDIFPRSIFLVSPGQVHQLLADGQPKGWVLLFTPEFLLKNNIHGSFINDLYLFETYGEAPPLPVSDHMYDSYMSILHQLEQYNIADMKYKYEALGALLKLFLILTNNACQLHPQANLQTVEVGNSVLRNFKSLLDQQYRTQHKVGAYAQQLAITPDHLNKTVKSLTGRSAKDIIQHKIVVEAKRNLLFSGLSTKELAYHLGFEEPAHFSNFFKKNTGLTPSKFKEQTHST